MRQEFPKSRKLSQNGEALAPTRGLTAALLVLVFALFALTPGHSRASDETDFTGNDPMVTRKAISLDQKNILPTASTKSSVIKNLKVIQAHQVQSLTELDAKIKKQMVETQDVRVKEAGNEKQAFARISHLTDSMQKLEATRQEMILRRRFTDQLIFSIDSKWTSGPLQVFLEKQFLDMALNEMNETTQKTGEGTSNLWKFYTYLSVAVRELPEPREDLVAFIEGYLNFSTISDPKPPNLYVEERSYSNGSLSQAAHQVNTEELGDGLEKRLRAQGLTPASKEMVSRRSSADIELKMHSTIKTPDEGVVSGTTQAPAPEATPQSQLN